MLIVVALAAAANTMLYIRKYNIEVGFKRFSFLEV